MSVGNGAARDPVPGVPVLPDPGRSGWQRDPTIVAGLPAWLRPYAAYATWRGRDGRRALLGSQWVARRLGVRRFCELRVDGLRVWVDLIDLRLPLVLSELRARSLQRAAISGWLGPGDTFIDVGANHGSFSLYAARRVGTSGAVHAIEPQPYLAALVRRSASANGFPQVRVHQLAASSHDGSGSLAGAERSGSRYLFPDRDPAAIGLPARMRTIDALLAGERLPGRILVKVDVEGHEVACLLGARALIEAHRPALVVEVNPAALHRAGTSAAELVTLLSDLGYTRFTDIARAPALFGADDIHVEAFHDLFAAPPGTDALDWEPIG